MSSRLIICMLFLCLLLGGCAMKAANVMPTLKQGMSPEQVADELGQPEAVKMVHFTGHKRPYVVWVYEMVPDRPLCPSEGMGRGLAAVLTLGVSEIGVTHAMASPHWIYFLDGKLAYTSKEIDCKEYDCQTYPVKVGTVTAK